MANNLTNSPGFIASSVKGTSGPPAGNTRSRKGSNDRSSQSDINVSASIPSGPSTIDVIDINPSAHSNFDAQANMSARSSRSGSLSNNDEQPSPSYPSRGSPADNKQNDNVATIVLLHMQLRAQAAEFELALLRERLNQREDRDVDVPRSFFRNSQLSIPQPVKEETNIWNDADSRISPRNSKPFPVTEGAFDAWKKPTKSPSIDGNFGMRKSTADMPAEESTDSVSNVFSSNRLFVNSGTFDYPPAKALIFKSSAASQDEVIKVEPDENVMTVQGVAEIYHLLGEGRSLTNSRKKSTNVINDDFFHDKYHIDPALNLDGSTHIEKLFPRSVMTRLVNAADAFADTHSGGPHSEVNALTKTFLVDFPFDPKLWSKKAALRFFIEYHKLQNAIQAMPSASVPKTFSIIYRNNKPLAEFLLKSAENLVNKVFKNCSPKLDFSVRRKCIKACEKLIASLDPMLLSLVFYATDEPMDFHADIITYIETVIVPTWPKWSAPNLYYSYFMEVAEVFKATIEMPIISLTSIGLKLFHEIDEANPNPDIVTTCPMTPLNNFGDALRLCVPFDAGIQYTIYNKLVLSAKNSREFFGLLSEIGILFEEFSSQQDSNATLLKDCANAPFSEELKMLNRSNGRIEVISKYNPRFKEFLAMLQRLKKKLSVVPTVARPSTSFSTKTPYLPKEDYKKLMQERRDAELNHASVKPNSQVSSKHAHFNGQVPNSMPRESDRARSFDRNFHDRHISHVLLDRLILECSCLHVPSQRLLLSIMASFSFDVDDSCTQLEVD